MSFACLYIPDFLVQAVVRGQRALADGALVLLEGAPPLWSVVAANPAAFAAGIQLGMTKAQVTQFANVQICMRSPAQEQAAHAALLDAAWSISPRVEDTAPDAVVLDLDGLSSLFGAEQNIAQELAQRVAAIGLAARVAIASNIEVAIHAARGFTGITIIPPGQERRCLSSLPVGVLATQPETLQIFERWGIATLQELAALPVLQLSERLGQEGVRLSELARGIRQRALVLAQASSTFSEELELDDAVEELEPLSFLLARLLDQLCARLQARALAVRAVQVRFELQPSFEKDFQALREDLRRKPPARQYQKVLALPVPLRNPKTLLKLLRLHLQGDPPPAPIQKIFMTADAAAPRVAQNGLFVPSGPDPEKLEVTIARLGKLVGEGNAGCAELLDSHRPESFRIVRFVIDAEREKKSIRRSGAAPDKQQAGATANPRQFRNLTALRVMRPPQSVRVDLRHGQPVRVYLRGKRGEVLAASGPWRSSGDWWQGNPWHQDEWDLEIAFPAPSVAPTQLYPQRIRENAALVSRHKSNDRSPLGNNNSTGQQRGLYRIFYDALCQTWFLRGEYD